MKQHSLFVEKYRPQSIDECILPPRLKDFFQAQVDKGEIQNMLLIGGAGTGKTTAAKALCKELGIDVLFINASESGGIDTIRNEIRSFASTISFVDGKVKCVILDESDYLSTAAQPALRAFIEEFSSNCRFILTANYANRIIDPIKSRCAVIDFVMNKEEKQFWLWAEQCDEMARQQSEKERRMK
jgi:DNA polymerase III delta prime subunit